MGIALVREIKAPENHANITAQFLTDYADVFPDKLPKGLPPQRKIDHTILEEPGSKPVNLPYYRMSPRELAEL